MSRAAWLLLVPLLMACPRGDRGASSRDGGGPSSAGDAAAAEEEPEPPPPTCEERLESARERIRSAMDERRQCRWDVDCVILDVRSGCAPSCDLAVASASVVAAREAVTETDRAVCPPFTAADCERPVVRCTDHVAHCVEGRCVAREASSPEPERPRVEVPPQNSARLTEAPPRPPAGDAEERTRRLWEAIVHDDPLRAMDFFFPREAFREVKGIPDPDRYYDRLLAVFVQDVHELHESTPDLDRAELVGLHLRRRGGWVPVGEEGNRLPYWASRHAWIDYRVGEEQRRMEVRVLITWGERWYVIHLNELR